jgi:hypothetical protein
MQVGAVSFSPDTRFRLANGRRLTPVQIVELQQLPALAVPFLEGIAPLAGVTALLQAAAGAEGPGSGINEILRIVVDLMVVEAEEASPEAAGHALRARGDRYHPELLKRYSKILVGA